jgi:hypothetical protein
MLAAPIIINKVRVINLRCPTSREHIGSDAVNKDPDKDHRHSLCLKPAPHKIQKRGHLARVSLMWIKRAPGCRVRALALFSGFLNSVDQALFVTEERANPIAQITKAATAR